MGLEFAALALFLFGGWIWVDGMRAREVALEVGRRACESEGLQFLDWSVSMSKMRVARSADGRLRVRRVYDFEFSDNGNNRLHGSIVLLGTQLVSLYLAPGEGIKPNNVANLH